MAARCLFYILNPDNPHDSRSLWPKTPGGSGLVLDHPPAVGDTIVLSGEMADPDDPEGERLVAVHGAWRVLARQWMPAAYGSVTWSWGSEATQPEPVTLDLMLERTDGMFAESQAVAAAPATDP